MPIPELLDDESSTWSSAREEEEEIRSKHFHFFSLKLHSRASELMSLPVLGVRGWLKSNCGLDVFGKSGHMEASSSAMKVDCDGEVVNDSGSCRNDASDETPMGFIFSPTLSRTAHCTKI
jgi:hypothetical protein